MDHRHAKWIAISAAFILVVSSLWVHVVAEPLGPAQSVQPKVTWSDRHIEVTLSPGEAASRDLTFTSTLDIEGIVIEPVPEIAGFLTIIPDSLVSVPRGQPQSVQISLVIPESTEPGIFGGTIHVKTGSQTLPQTLKVEINVWKSFRSPQAAYTIKFPPELEISDTSDGQNLGLITESTKLARSLNAVEAFDDISIVVEAKLDDLSIIDFAELYDDGWFQNYKLREEVVINGHEAVRFSDIGAVPGRAPMITVFLEAGSRVFIFSIGRYESPESTLLVSVFDDVVSTFELTD